MLKSPRKKRRGRWRKNDNTKRRNVGARRRRSVLLLLEVETDTFWHGTRAAISLLARRSVRELRPHRTLSPRARTLSQNIIAVGHLLGLEACTISLSIFAFDQGYFGWQFFAFTTMLHPANFPLPIYVAASRPCHTDTHIPSPHIYPISPSHPCFCFV